MRSTIILLLLASTSARDWRTAAFWPEVLESLEGRPPQIRQTRTCVVGADCRAAILVPAAYRESKEGLETIRTLAQSLTRVLQKPTPVFITTEPPYDGIRIRQTLTNVHIRELTEREMNAQKRLPFWLRQWYKHALVLKQVDHNERRHGPIDVLVKIRFDARLKFRDDASLKSFLETIIRERDAVWAWFEMTWVASSDALRPLLGALTTDAAAPEAFDLTLDGAHLQRWDACPADHWFAMMAGSDLMFPGYNAETLSQLKTSKETKVWRRNKPRFWPGVSSEELFVASLLRRSLVRLRRTSFQSAWATAWRWKSRPHQHAPAATTSTPSPRRRGGEDSSTPSPTSPSQRAQVLKDLGKVPGVTESGWTKDWERWVSAEGCKLGNVVKLDGPVDAATYGTAALDVKIYPDGVNASKGRFNSYFARNFSDAELRDLMMKRVKKENPTCGPTSYLFGHGMLERIYPGFFGKEFSERRLQDVVRKGKC